MLIGLNILTAMLRSLFMRVCFPVGAWLRPHDFELLVQTRFVDFLFFELIFERGDIAKRSKSATVHVLKTSLFQIEIAVLPELFLRLTLIEFVTGLLQVGQEDPTLVDEDGDDSLELLGVLIVELP